MSEKQLAELSYPDAPQIVTDKVPGPKSEKVLGKSFKHESMARGAGRFPVVFDEGLGATIKDPDGNLFIDITAGVAVTSVGRRHPRVIEAIEGQLSKLLHACDLSSTHRAELAGKVSSVMPKGLRNHCVTYFTQSGSGAVETAIKFACRMTGRTQIVAFHGGYHGIWCGSGSLTTGDQYRQLGPHIPGVIHAPYAYCYRCCFNMKYPDCGVQCAKYLDYLLNTPYTAADDVAAVIVEPQQGEGGYLPAPPEFLRVLKKACQRHGALFIADEVQAGAGRTGKMWSIEHSGVVPDMITWGKGMGGDMPMAGVTFHEDLAKEIADGSQPNTFAANGLSAAACMANIDLLTEKKGALIKRAGELGEEIKDRLAKGARRTRIIGDVRGQGLMIGIELVKDKRTREPLDGEAMGQIVFGLLNGGVIMVPCGRWSNVLRFMPALTITKEYCQKATDILLAVVKKM
ncbi:MAG: aspartate aminotransferase family protein [Deltaproteobacteria bacterium]|nr:aspartate aminotransferase family protein [Deltaproteobacteria bacterium]